MSTVPILPAVRMTAEGDIFIQEGVSLDSPAKNRFSVSYAPLEGRRNSFVDETHNARVGRRTNPIFSDGEPFALEGDSGEELETVASKAPPKTSSQSTLSPLQTRMRSFTDTIAAPTISRTLSMPLTSQLSHLQNPHRLAQSDSSMSTPVSPSAQSEQVREVSVELADSIQLVIQTMLQISPPQVLDPAKEQFSACALSVPTSSMSALFTAMKNINYISANMSAFCEGAESATRSPTLGTLGEASSSQSSGTNHNMYNEFDIGETLQCVGDALSGSAANAGVDLVLYHGDVGLKHICVSGDESGISFALSHIVRQVLSTAERGDSIELGLLVSPITNPLLDPHGPMESPPVDDMLSAAPLQSSGPVRIKIRISHKYAPLETSEGSDHPPDVVTTEIRPKPSFSTLLLRRILKEIDGTLLTDLPPPEAFTSGRTCDLEMVLDRVPLPIHSTLPQEYVEGSTNEPTLEQLSAFGETLKGKKVTLYASAKGSFAHHLTSYLTAWGMDVTHVSPDGQVDGVSDHATSMQEEARLSSQFPRYLNDAMPNSQMTPEPVPTEPAHPNFIFIDDDIDVLKERLQAYRFDNQPTALNNPRKRPSLSSNHRPRSSPTMTRLANFQNNFTRPTPVVIMHFTSLSNYKMVRDIMQSVVVSYAATSTPLPEVMIIPKPAGPRRFLTALHTAVTKPFVDPLFIPIATSPMSPGIPHATGSFFPSAVGEHGGQGGGHDHALASQTMSPSMKNSGRPMGNSRHNSDRSSRSTDNNNLSVLPPSPLALPDNVEYFSAAAEKLGTSPSSGLVIQSPDGQTAGIYFHPRSKGGFKNLSSQAMERDRGHLSVPSSRRASTSRIPSGGNVNENVTFATLHETHEATQLDIPASSTVAILSPRLLSVGPMEDQHEQPSLASSILSPVPRTANDDVRRISTPSGENNPPVRRNVRRNDSKDLASGGKLKGKVMNSDNVVPPISVLIVDDNPINQTILSTFMRRKRIKYDLASNGQEAVQKWRTGGFHLILMDIQMPVMDGIQATKEIRRLEKSNAAAGYPPVSPTSTDGKQTPATSQASSIASDTRAAMMNSPYRSSVIIVALTASSLQTDRVAALAAGCNDFLTKPVSLLWLNNKIIEWGSIKALQMWADIRPDGVRKMNSGLDAQAKNVADKLQLPESKGRTTPPPLTIRRPTSVLEDNAAALALASSSGGGFLNAPLSPLSSSFAFPDRARSGSPNLSSSGQNTRSNSLDNLGRSSFDVHPFRRITQEDEQDTTPKASTPGTNVIYRESGARTTSPIHELSNGAPAAHTDDSGSSSTIPDRKQTSESEGEKQTRPLIPPTVTLDGPPPENTNRHAP